MKQSVLIIGKQASGKTTKLKNILKKEPTAFVLDGATTAEAIEDVRSRAAGANSFAAVTTQMEDLPKGLLSKFEVIRLKPRTL